MGIGRIVDQDKEKKMGICSIVEQSFGMKIVYVKQGGAYEDVGGISKKQMTKSRL